MQKRQIVLKKVKVHNLKSIDVTLEANKLIVFTGVSGSGKSSLAFDTLYTEGQRRYVESLSTFARRQMGELAKPDIESAEGITPTIAIEQKTAGRNPRSTVGTMTEIYDYLRVLYARVGIPHCPVSGERVSPQSRERIIKTIQSLPEGTKLILLAPFAEGKKGEFKEDFEDLLRKGFMRARVDGKIINLSDGISLEKNIAHDIDVVIDRITVTESNYSRIAEGITSALNMSQGLCKVIKGDQEEELLFSMHAFSPKSGLSYSSLEPHDFSFNSPSGMCSRCNGLGHVTSFNLEKIINPNLSISEDCCSVASSYNTVRFGNIYDNLARIYKFKVTTPWKDLSDEAKDVFLHGNQKKWTQMKFVHPVTGKTWNDYIKWQGVLHEALQRYQEAKSDFYRSHMDKLMQEQECPDCRGCRLKAYPAATLVANKNISEITSMTIGDALQFFKTIQLYETDALIAEELLKEIIERLSFLIDVGLHYLSLERTAPTLSGGEAQRVRLASQIGCGLVGITYILDEPSIGLHPRDNKKLLSTLKHLRDIGNTVVVVEHDEETIWEADHILDFGPGPGSRGGELIVDGDLENLLDCKNSLTGDYLTGRKSIPIPSQRRPVQERVIEIKGACHHNLKNVNVKIPLGLFVAVTGVSGSGKSSLITDILYPKLVNHLHHGEMDVGAHKSLLGIEHIDKVIGIDQTPIGRSPRSNPSTYIKLFDEIRDLFSQLPESKARGYKAGRFSFNVKEGSCPQCSGMGMVRINMDFMEDAWIECPLCKGMRFDQETLSVFYKGKTIYDILEMEVGAALDFFQNIPKIRKKLETLHRVGMEYIKLGQSSTTLSGGEAQRIKLAKELSRPSSGNTFYILDEPTTGLHFHDIKHLLEVLHELVDRGNTVLVIEHNMDVVKTADWIIDMGPEGGAGGGEVVATGKPESLAKKKTATGVAILGALKPDIKEKIEKVRAASRARKKETWVDTSIREIRVVGAEQHNLKQINVSIPRDKITICTGPSGSGKTSLAFDTIYAEGQRRYIESLSPYARQFVKQMPKAKVAQVEGLSPAIAIEQKAHAGNPRSTIGTMTEIYDYLRILFARIGTPHCPETGEVIQAISKDHVADRVLSFPKGTKIQVLAPITMRKSDSFPDIIARLRRQGFVRIRLNETFYDLDLPEDQIPFDRKRKNALYLVVDRLKVEDSIKNRLLEAIENAATLGSNQLLIMKDEEDLPFNLAFAVESTGKSYPEITPQSFAFNTADGMCHDCQGLGVQYGANLIHNGALMERSITGLARLLWLDKFSRKAFRLLETICDTEGIDPVVPLKKLKKEDLQLLMNGSPEGKWYPFPKETGLKMRWVGINQVLAKAGRSGRSDLRQAVIPILEEHTCLGCDGERVNTLARHVTIGDVSIGKLCHRPIENVIPFVEVLKFDQSESKVLDEVKKQLLSRLHFLNEVGLHYISLDRRAPSLSGGEAQRIRLARQLGSSLTGVLYVLDEPTIGLHPRDTDRLNRALEKLKLLGNTLLMVEHDPRTIEHGDYILDFGPQSGKLGGHIVAQGTFKELQTQQESLTGAYLSGKKTIPIPTKRRKRGKEALRVTNASLHNLKGIDVTFPVGLMTAVTGVSGSGKSTLLNQILLPAVDEGLLTSDTVVHHGATVSGISNIDKLIPIDQNPIGHTNRANVCTYVDVLTRIREFFAQLHEAKIRGLRAANFSYNHRRGMCTHCWGLGYRKIEMHFLPPIQVVCEECRGMRLNPVSLGVRYLGKSLGEYLQYTVDEARIAFQNHPRITRILDTLISVGLGYLQLGQEMATLSGGEAQRIKLSRELSKRSSGRTLYILDEPTTGLHSEDILKLLKVLHKLVDKGNTMIIIEHNVDIIRNCDYVIDLGPEAGEKGGAVIAVGTPEEIAATPSSFTGHYL